MTGQPRGRGTEAVRDMQNRLADGWTVEQLWGRLTEAESASGFTYEYANGIPEDPNLRKRKDQVFL